MKLHEPNNQVQLLDQDQSTETSFRINTSAKMFKILSDGIYKFKIKAVIRELSTNAADAHIAANKADRPFEVTLPSWNNNNFAIRDFGPGMSEETIMTLYSTYGMSDKDTSNNFTGCLGLGSKSPFCYHTKAFTVESYQNGIKKTYNCYMNKEFIPCITKVYEGETTEEDGLKVNLAVSTYDKSEFEREAVLIYSYFKTTPVFKNNTIVVSKIAYKKIIDLGTAKFGIRESKGGNGCQVVMGNVVYPLEMQHITNDKLKCLQNSNVDIFVEIGDVSIDVSREGLSYDNKTIAYLTNTLALVYKELVSDFQAKIDACENRWKAHQQYNEFFNSLDYNLRNIISNANIKYNRSLISNSILLNSTNRDGILIESCFGVKKFKESHSITFPCKLIIDDLNIGAKSRIIYVRDTAGVPFNNEFKNNNVYLIKLSGETAKNKKFFEFLGIPFDKYTDSEYTIRASELTKPPVNNNGFKRGKSAKTLQFDHTKSGSSYQWKDAVIDLTQGGVYVEVYRWDILNSDGISNSTLKEILQLLEKNGVKLKVINGFRQSEVAKVKGKSGWTSVNTYLNQELKKLVNDEQVKKYWYDRTISSYSHYIKVLASLNKTKSIPSKEVQGALKLVEDIENVKYDAYLLPQICARLNLTNDIGEKVKSAVKNFAEQKYLFQFVMENVGIYDIENVLKSSKFRKAMTEYLCQ